jgi:hypothetical protein
MLCGTSSVYLERDAVIPRHQKQDPSVLPKVRSALGHAHPLVVPGSGDPVVDSVSSSPLGPVAPVMPSIRRSLSSGEEDRLSSRAADAYAKPAGPTALFLVPDSQLDSAVETDLLARSTDKYVSVGGGGQAPQKCNQRACNQAPNGRVESQGATSLQPDRAITTRPRTRHVSPLCPRNRA